jgi:hypothetical protein
LNISLKNGPFGDFMQSPVGNGCPPIQPKFFHLLSHPGPVIAAKTGAALLSDVRQQDPFRALMAAPLSSIALQSVGLSVNACIHREETARWLAGH